MRIPAFAVLLALTPLPLAVPAAFADPVAFTETVRVEGQRFEVPMQLDLSQTGLTRVAVRLTGDLGAIQRNLPGLLSRHIEDSCERRLSIAVADAKAEGDTIRLSGQLQLEAHSCRKVGGVSKRERMLNQTASVETVLSGEIVDGCLVMRVVETDIRPDGLAGALMTATGITARLNRDLEKSLDEALNDGENCIDLPPEFTAFDTVITGGRFTDVGDGVIGAEITGEMEIDARNFIRLIHLMGAEGKIGN